MMYGRTVKALSAAALAGMLAAPAMAEEAPSVNSGKISLTAGVDWVSQYYFRGVNILNNGIILQPYVDLGFNLWEGDGPINSLSANVGIWNSFSDNHAVTGGARGTWTEADLYGGVTVGFLDTFTLSGTYVVYKYPDSVSSAEEQEVQFKLTYDDSELMGPFALSPYVMYAIQLKDNVSGDEGQYLEVGFSPSVVLLESKDYPITLTVPVVAGFSLDGAYVKDATGANMTFGYASIGLMLSTPLSFIPADYGTWTLTAGPQYLILNDEGNNGMNAGGNDNVILAKVGISMSY